MSFSVPMRVVRTNLLHSGAWIQLAITHFGIVNMPTSLDRPTFQQPFWMIYMHQDPGGEMLHESGEVTPLPPGRVVAFPPWQRWKVVTRRPLRHIYLVFELPQIPPSLVRQHFYGARPLPDDATGRDIARVIAGIAGEIDGTEPPSLACTCRAQAVAYRVLEQVLTPLDHLHPPSEPVQAVLEHVEHELASDCRVSTLARRAGIGIKALNTACIAALGVSAAAFVRDRRLARAADLLLTSEWDLERIATESGFANRHYLSRMFARRMGLPPATYRAQGRPAR